MNEAIKRIIDWFLRKRPDLGVAQAKVARADFAAVGEQWKSIAEILETRVSNLEKLIVELQQRCEECERGRREDHEKIISLITKSQ